MLNEKQIDFLEKQIPIMAEYATKQAYIETLASGDKVMIADNGKLVEVYPDGTRKIIKEIAKPIKVTQSSFKIKS
ncbi:MAG: hypothetical protein MUF45_13280 [Spirosomaceae bacterium]|nr:hypothetical protein [Spirosomataceae bacterium]